MDNIYPHAVPGTLSCTMVMVKAVSQLTNSPYSTAEMYKDNHAYIKYAMQYLKEYLVKLNFLTLFFNIKV